KSGVGARAPTMLRLLCARYGVQYGFANAGKFLYHEQEAKCGDRGCDKGHKLIRCAWSDGHCWYGAWINHGKEQHRADGGGCLVRVKLFTIDQFCLGVAYCNVCQAGYERGEEYV